MAVLTRDMQTVNECNCHFPVRKAHVMVNSDYTDTIDARHFKNVQRMSGCAECDINGCPVAQGKLNINTGKQIL